jgi:hypothetical protein
MNLATITDQFVVHTPGQRLDGYGRDGPECSLDGGTLYTDAASNFVYVECQTSMGAGETVMGKTRFEQMCWNLAGVTIKNFHSDNGVYDASVFCEDCISKDQLQTFSGVGAKHAQHSNHMLLGLPHDGTCGSTLAQ